MAAPGGNAREKASWVGYSCTTLKISAVAYLRWAEAAVVAGDNLSPSGNRAQDWDPHLVRFEPLLLAAVAGPFSLCQPVTVAAARLP